ncbi:amidophosphoribosyltransferase, partial [Genlisea aurea]
DVDKPREECGVMGIYGDPEASRLAYLGLHALQHRGQEGAGIVSSEDGEFHAVTGVGLVSEVLDQSKLDALPGSMAIGHVRYSTSGASMLKNVQPFVSRCGGGTIGVAHNGNLVNYHQLRSELEGEGSIFATTSDTEVVLHLIAAGSKTGSSILSRIVEACERIQGAFSMVLMTGDGKMVAVRDPLGFRPLVMGRRKNGAVVFASETCALDLIEARYEREVFPGEVVVVEEGIVVSSFHLTAATDGDRRRSCCVFEHIYFALPNSNVFGRSVYESRLEFGRILAAESPADCDVVISVPDSGTVAALGYAEEAGVPFQQGLIRSHYARRTFIEPIQSIRDAGVKLKLSPVKEILAGKRVAVVDDSLVRGTTCRKIVGLLRSAGAAEVHVRIASPPFVSGCYYGVDVPDESRLMAAKMSVEEMKLSLGADSLAFLSMDGLKKSLGANDAPHFCYGCFTGKYPLTP